MRWHKIIFIALCTVSTGVNAAGLSLESGPRQTVMIELFTSQGCSSCPPADHFLNQFVSDHRLWKTYIPLAFHVDYWDYLGWRDRFASSANSRRQRTYARTTGARAVYTPEFFVNGKEWRRAFFNRLSDVPTPDVGILKLRLDKQGLQAYFEPTQNYPQALALHVALLGMHLSNTIRAGENAGRHLQHQFVVLQHITVISHSHHWQTVSPLSPLADTKQLAVAAWVSKISDPRPIQAVGAYLPRQ